MYDDYDKNPDKYNHAEKDTLKPHKDSWFDAFRAKISDWAGGILERIKNNFGIGTLANKVLEKKM